MQFGNATRKAIFRSGAFVLRIAERCVDLGESAVRRGEVSPDLYFTIAHDTNPAIRLQRSFGVSDFSY